jgi:hypothetical protein
MVEQSNDGTAALWNVGTLKDLPKDFPALHPSFGRFICCSAKRLLALSKPLCVRVAKQAQRPTDLLSDLSD